MLTSLRSRLNQWIGDASLQRLLKNASLLFGAETVVTLISLVQFPLVTRLLGPENYGAWGIASSWAGLVAQIISFRLWETVIKYVSQFVAAEDESRALAVIKLVLLIDFTVAAATFLVVSTSADLAARFVMQTRPDGADLIRLEAFNMLASVSMSVWMAILRVFDRFRFISAYNIVSAIALFIFWMAALSLKAGVGGLILATAIVKLGQTAALALMARRELRRKFERSWFAADLNALRGHRRELWVMLFSMNVDSFRKIVTANADMVVLGWLTTPAQAGIYRLAKQLSTYLSRITNPIYDTLYPEVARLYGAGDITAIRLLVKRLIQGAVVGLSVALVGAYLLSPWLVPTIFGVEYIPAIPLFYVVVLTNIWIVGLWIPSVMLASGKAKQLTLINTLSALGMLAVLIGLVTLWGTLGAAIAQISFHLIWLALAYPAGRKVLAESPAKSLV